MYMSLKKSPSGRKTSSYQISKKIALTYFMLKRMKKIKPNKIIKD